jgi:SAM-dependent methyltransferase
MSRLTDAHVWADATAHEIYIGRWSRKVSQEFLAWLAAPTDRRWLDVGCGPGPLSHAIVALAAPRAVLGLDRSEDFVRAARRQIADPRVRFVVADAQALPVENAAHDVVVAALVLNFLPEPQRAVSDMARATHPGGMVAAYIWDYAGEMQFMRYFWAAARALDPRVDALDAELTGQQVRVCKPEPLAGLFHTAGLHAVEVRAIDVSTHFRDFDDFWLPHVQGSPSLAPRYTRSLGEAQRTPLRERLCAALPYAPDGSIPLIAHAWAVRGMR